MFVRSSTSTFLSQPLPSLAALATLRDAFVSWLVDLQVEGDQIEELAVVVSELGANAIRESPAGSAHPTLGAQQDGTRFSLQVGNAVGTGTTSAHEHHWDLDDALRTGGRGLLLVSAFVDDVAVEVDDERLVVRCTARLRFTD